MLSLIVIRPGWHHHQRLWGGVRLSISTHWMPLLESKCFVRTNCCITFNYTVQGSDKYFPQSLLVSTRKRRNKKISTTYKVLQKKNNIWLDLNYHTLLIQNSMRAVISCRTKYKAWSMLWHPGEKQPILLIWHPGIINSDFFFFLSSSCFLFFASSTITAWTSLQINAESRRGIISCKINCHRWWQNC